MKRFVGLAVLALTLALVGGRSRLSAHTDDGLPVLHKIQSVTLSPSYSCRAKESPRKGYEGSALFLSSYSKERNAPDLLFNGACGSGDYFQGSTAGDDMSLIADLGDIRLEDVSAQLAFNPKNVLGKDARFQAHAPVLAGHTYSLVIDKSDFRGLAVLRVEDYLPNKSVRLRYAVEEYQLVATRAQSLGFSWDGRNKE